MTWTAKEETDEKKQSRNTTGMGGGTKDAAHYPVFEMGFNIHNDVSVVIWVSACY
jgi:hypothetical protein